MSSALPRVPDTGASASVMGVCGLTASERVEGGFVWQKHLGKRKIYLLNLSQHKYRIFLYNEVSLPVKSGKRQLSCFSLGSN